MCAKLPALQRASFCGVLWQAALWHLPCRIGFSQRELMRIVALFALLLQKSSLFKKERSAFMRLWKHQERIIDKRSNSKEFCA